MKILPIGPLQVQIAPTSTPNTPVIPVSGNTGIVPPWLLDRAAEAKRAAQELSAS